MDDSIGVKVGESPRYVVADIDLHVKWEEAGRVVEKLRQVFIVHQLHEQQREAGIGIFIHAEVLDDIGVP